MSLSDPGYVGFLFLCVVLFYLLRPGKPRRVLLLAASYFFYFQLSHYYIAVLLSVTAVVYFGARWLRSPNAAQRGSILFILLCTVVLTPLLIFKYLSALLISTGTAAFFGQFGNELASLALPIGISFFTFAALGYLIDVYLEVVDPETDASNVALFLAFFPLISAGPIERASRFLPQLDLQQRFSAERAFAASRLILIGLVLKTCFASALFIPMSRIYAAPKDYSALEQLCGTIYYVFYVYADFCGYSLIAIGSAKLFGLEVRPNFTQPFLSASVPEFWRNWHISLSSWVRDYLFTPLRMNWRHLGNLGLAGALLISFVVIGVWHGARWGWLVFGIIHGVFCIASAFTLPKRDAWWKSSRIPSWLIHGWRVVVTFLLVELSFVVVRADTLTDAAGIYRSIFSLEIFRNIAAAPGWYLHHTGGIPVLITGERWWALIAIIVAGDILARRKFRWEKVPIPLQLSLYNIGILFVLLKWLNGLGNEPFVYYKF